MFYPPQQKNDLFSSFNQAYLTLEKEKTDPYDEAISINKKKVKENES